MTDKVQAIFDLREAAEEHARAEMVVDMTGSAEAKDDLLDARLNLENKTQDAIESCHQCGQKHAPEQEACEVIPFPNQAQGRP